MLLQFILKVRSSAFVKEKVLASKTVVLVHSNETSDETFLHAKKANVPTLGPRFLVKFLRVGMATEAKCPT